MNSLSGPAIGFHIQPHLSTRVEPSTDPFHQRCFIYLGRGCLSICPIAALKAYLHQHAPNPGAAFVHQDGQPLFRVQLSHFLQPTLSAAGIWGSFSDHTF